LAIRGGMKAARNGAIMCAIFLAVIEGVGIGFQRMMAEQTRLDVSDWTVFLTSALSQLTNSLVQVPPPPSSADSGKMMV
jgi:hypothetical protein